MPQNWARHSPQVFPEYFWAISKIKKNIILVDIERTLLIHDYSLLFTILYLLGEIPLLKEFVSDFSKVTNTVFGFISL